jgi:hypothetical protein
MKKVGVLCRLPHDRYPYLPYYNMNKKCPFCGSDTDTSICANCAYKLEFLGVKSLPDPDASQEEVMEWAKQNKITAFSCSLKD